MLKKVKYLLPSSDVNMGGVIVKQALPTQHVPQIDPFLLLHHAKFSFTDTARALHQGLGPHPHRGFTPVSFVIKGEVHHRDSRGNNQIAKTGEVQWMHAGRGIIHSERPSQALVEENGMHEIIQLWINSPAEKKMSQPKYQYIKESDIPVFSSEDGLVKNKLIAGKSNDLRGKIQTESELLILWSKAKQGGAHTFSIPEKFNATIYIVSGELRVKGFGKIEEESLILFENENTDIEITANVDTEFVVLAGVPIGEKVVQQGPFVMNSETQILEAMRDYRMGKMGILIEE